VPSRSRRKTEWDVGPGGSSVTNITSSAIAILGSGIALVGGAGEVTIVRIRGHFEGILKSATAAASGFHCAFGIGLITSAAFAVGISAIPGPLSEIGWDGWMYHTFFDLHAVTGTTADGVNAMSNYIRFPVDTKAMRIFETDMTLVPVLETVEAGVATLDVFFDSRLLAKLV